MHFAGKCSHCGRKCYEKEDIGTACSFSKSICAGTFVEYKLEINKQKWYCSEYVCQDQYEALEFFNQHEEQGFEIKTIIPPNRYPGTVVFYSKRLKVSE